VRRRQVLDLVRNLQRERRFTALFVTHDLQVARYMADTLWVMKDGEIVDTLARPFASQHMHPYTALLMSAADPMVTAPQGGVMIQPFNHRKGIAKNEDLDPNMDLGICRAAGPERDMPCCGRGDGQEHHRDRELDI
jgi:ABC-type dipeptide/oligopeptide/nickel transport system ATPase component